MKKILITGASGFIGRNCLRALLRLGYEVHAVCPDSLEEAYPAVKWHRADLLKLEEAKELVAGLKATHLLHFAWYAEPKKYWTSDENFKWVRASTELLKEFYSNGGHRAVMAGTCAEYDWGQGICSENTTPLLPTTVYGKCKHSLQGALADFSGKTGLSSAWGRIFFLYGPNEHPARLVSSVIISLLQGKPASCSYGNQIRDFLHVEDVASAFVALLESDVRGAVNIASGRPIALKEVICKIGEKLKQPKLIRLGDIPSPKDEPPLLVADVKRLKEEVGWAPKYDIDSGLDQTIKWWKAAI
jgi:nucleoside-diphosphate-sugar epimerase